MYRCNKLLTFFSPVHEDYYLEIRVICKLVHFNSPTLVQFSLKHQDFHRFRYSCLLPLKSQHICNLGLKMDNVAADSGAAVTCGRMLGGGLWVTSESGAVSLPWQGALQISVWIR